MTFDPITFEVIRNALVAATDEMVLALKRSAYSTNIKTRSDFSCAFFDAELRSVAQGFTQPVHLGSMVEQIPRAVRDYGPERLRPGDVLITNEPFPSGVHLNDISLISPVYDEEELLGYVANLAHHVDVGGGAPASIGAFREVFQEGVIIPPVRVVERGRIVPDVFTFILAQIRSKHETGGDLRAQVAANATGVRRLQALVGRHGRETLVAAMAELLDYTERRTRAELATLPHGTYEAEGFVDTDGYTDEPVRLCARVEISTEGVAFDLTGSDPQRRAPVNSTYAQTFSACAYALKCLIDPDLPVNDGFYRLVSLHAPSGTVTNCTWPSPVVGGWETQTRLVDVIFRALLPALPERLPAGTKAMMCHAGFGGVDPQTNQYYCFLETFAGGYGGRAGSDGPDAVQTHGQNTENAPVEETELNYPVRIARLSLVDDSDGAGRFRGGLGLRKDFVFDRTTTFTVLADRTVAGPAGAFGGLPGKTAEFVLIRDGAETQLGAKTTIEVEPGDTISYRTCGGGGYGPPLERDRDLVARDVREGKVSLERAREVYGVAVDPITFEVIRNALVAATDEMVLALKRSAYSTNIKTRSDFSCAFFDAGLRPVAQGFAQPVHLGSMVEQVPKAVQTFGAENLGPGDVIVTNDPHPSGVHLNDVSLVSPVYVGEELLGYVANLAHHVDVGGGAPASIGAFREVFQEGVIIPPVRFVEGGAIVDDIFKLILAQIRSKHETGGDFRAQIAANATGVRRVVALVERHGRETILATMEELLEYTERRTLAELEALPAGVYEAEGTVDNDGYTDDPVRLRARIEIGPTGIRFDLTGSDPQRRAPVNSTYAQTFSACAYAFKCLIDPDLPVNDGFYRLVGVNAPAGSVVNCTWPAPVVGGWETHARLIEVMFRALLPAFPERLPAGTKGMMCQAGFGSLDAAAGKYTCFYDTFAGGYGGRAGSDGPDAVQSNSQNTENAPIEETELNYPVRIDGLSLVENSEGPGRFRGGLGLRKDYRFDLHTTFTVLADRDRAGPWGAFGGGAGLLAEYVHIRDGVETRLGSKSTVELVPGDVISVRSCGGGGYGPPEEREPERVLRDVLEGKVSAERARDVYRVEVADGRVDEAATGALRG